LAPDSLTRYLTEIRRYPLLSRERESALGERIRLGDHSATQELVCANLRFVVAIAKKYQHQGVPLADLVNEGNVGLMRAAMRFDDSRGVRFISYAVWWVRQAIIQALAEHSHAVRIPVNRAGIMYRINRHANTLRHELGREPTPQEIAEQAGVSEAEIATILPISRAYLSLDTNGRATNDGALLDFLPDPGAEPPDTDVTTEALTKSVLSALDHLAPRESMVLRRYFGFDGDEPMTLEEIGGELGVTRERVRQLKDRALHHLRSGRDRDTLEAFIYRDS
jgi:RNA polymerase primary sigma factor